MKIIIAKKKKKSKNWTKMSVITHEGSERNQFGAARNKVEISNLFNKWNNKFY